MRSFTKDDVFEVLVIKQTDGVRIGEALETLLNREPTEDEITEFFNACEGIRRGWVQMNINCRNIGKR